MKRKLVTLAFPTLIGALSFASPALAGDHYFNCYVSGGVAHAQFCSQSSASGSGTGYIYSYDESGTQTGSTMAVWVGVAVMGCDEVATMSVSGDTVSCTFQ